jgi:branched-subunit amino acid aminotransferase/4-amino-4-deoxychorismate lyase
MQFSFFNSHFSIFNAFQHARMHRLIYQNDRIVDASEARIAPTAAGLLYGWGVFTNLPIYDGKAFAFDRHWKRLMTHAERARIPAAVDLTKARRALDKLIVANSVEQGRARLTLLKGDAGSWLVEPGREIEFLIFTSSDAPGARTDLAITLSPYRVLSTALLAGVKQTAMLENLFALEEARSRDFDEAVLLNERGEIVSATAANIFWVQGDEVFTPSIPTGCVAGITRHFIHDITTRWKLHLVEGSFSVQRLLDAREVFLTSTAREVTIVSSFDSRQYVNKQARIAKLISREFQKLVRDAKIES